MRAQALELLLGSPERAASTAASVEATGGWPRVIEVCAEWRVLTQLNSRLREINRKLPEETRGAFRQRAQKAFLRNSQTLMRGAVALHALRNAGILAVGFKGIPAAAMLHNHPGDRTLQDVDILIRERDLEAAIQTLRTAGFLPAIPGTFADYIDFVRNSPGFSGNEAVALADQKGGSVDLHWRLGSLPAEPLLHEAVEVNLFGRDVLVTRPAHSLTISAHHAMRNDFVPDEIIRDLLDVRGWLPHLENLNALEEARSFANATHLYGPVLALSELLGAYGNPLPAAIAREAESEERRFAEDLKELCQDQIQDGRLNTDVFYIASPGALRQMLSGALNGWGRYRTHMRALEQTNGRSPVGLGTRLRKFAQSTWRMPLRRWRLVRKLAAIKEQNLR